MLFSPSRALILMLALTSAGCSSEPAAQAETPGDTAPTTDEQKTLYALGMMVSQNLAQLSLSEAELKVVQQGLTDGVLRREPKVDMQAFGPKIQTFAEQRMSQAAASEQAAAKTFLDQKAAESGARRTESGLIYTELSAGTGASPQPTDSVKVHYTGTLRDGKVFDSSKTRGEPVTFPLNQVIPCWTEGVGLMKVGGKSRLVCPAALAYGDRGAPPVIPPGAALVFEVELLEIVATP